MTHPRTALIPVAVVALATGCGRLSSEEARAAMDQIVHSSEASALQSDVIELTTRFTLAQGREAAAAELARFIESQIPCASVARGAGTVTVDFGARSSGCTHRGRTYSGQVAVALEQVDASGAQIGHTWTRLSDGRITLDGTAHVTWSAPDARRRVLHEATWTTAEGRVVDASGDRTQRLIDPTVGIAGGLRIDGNRRWITDAGTWTLDIEGVEARGEDPVPQAGRYVLVTAQGEAVTATFSRIDPDVIEVRLEGPRRGRTFRVRRSGAIEDA